jgi:hypothetical protein
MGTTCRKSKEVLLEGEVKRMKSQKMLKIQKLRGVAGLAAAVMLIASAQAATAAPNLSGEWKLNLSKSNYGSFPAPLGATRKIVHSDPKLSMTTMQRGTKGEVTSQLNYTTDGKESVNPSPNGESKGAAQWIGDKLMIESSREVQGTVLKQKEIWTMSGDGKTLTIDAHVSLPNGEFDVKQVFEKQ